MTPELITVKDFAGRYGDGLVSLTGRIWPDSNSRQSRYQLSLNFEQVKFDDDLFSLVPESRKEIITDLKLQTDRPTVANCSDCTKCITACPTGALRPDGQFDAGRCINYLTIEYKGLSRELAKTIGNRLFGCEECIRVCPYQHNAPTCANREFIFYPDRAEFHLRKILDMSPELFEAEFANSVIKRLGLSGLQRNARICLDNISGRS